MVEQLNQPEEKQRGVPGQNMHIVETKEGTVVSYHSPAEIPLDQNEKKNPIPKRRGRPAYQSRRTIDIYQPESVSDCDFEI
jgi:hypothetical protein